MASVGRGDGGRGALGVAAPPGRNLGSRHE
jgi:hypothetical protein